MGRSIIRVWHCSHSMAPSLLIRISTVKAHWLASVLLLGCFHIAFRTLFKLLLALDSTEEKGLPLIAGRCGCILRVDFHSADGITHGRRLAFHESLLQVGVSLYFKGSARRAPLAHSLV